MLNLEKNYTKIDILTQFWFCVFTYYHVFSIDNSQNVFINIGVPDLG